MVGLRPRATRSDKCSRWSGFRCEEGNPAWPESACHLQRSSKIANTQSLAIASKAEGTRSSSLEQNAAQSCREREVARWCSSTARRVR